MSRILIPISTGGIDLDVVTTKPGDILDGKVTIGPDGEPIEGTMPERTADNVSINTANGTITIPDGHYKATTKAQANKGADGISVSAAGVISVAAGWYNAITKALSTFGAQAIAAGASEKTIETRGKWGTGNITVAAEPAIPAQYLKKGYQHKMADGRVITGTFEGWVPEPQDLYYNGVNIIDFFVNTSDWRKDNTQLTRISANNSADIRFPANDIDVRSHSKLIVEGKMHFKDPNYVPTKDLMIKTQSYESSAIARTTLNAEQVYTSVSVDISQLTTIPANAYLAIPSNGDYGSYVTRIRLA